MTLVIVCTNERPFWWGPLITASWAAAVSFNNVLKRAASYAYMLLVGVICTHVDLIFTSFYFRWVYELLHLRHMDLQDIPENKLMHSFHKRILSP